MEPLRRRIWTGLVAAAIGLVTCVTPARALEPSAWLLSPAQRLERNVAAGRPYFIDFRAGMESITGHSFVVVGRVDPRGRVLFMKHAEIWPESGDAGLFVGIFVPVRAQVRLVDGDSKQHAVVSYRRYLTEAEFAVVMRTIQKERRQDLFWSVWLFNCNHFTSNVAEALGLRTPSGLLMPHAYVSALRLLNGRQD
jgi:hypothetical protein